MGRSGLALSIVLACGLLAAGNPLLGAETVTVEIQKYEFNPPEITVKVGTTVRWVNKEKRQYHSVWFKELDAKVPDYFFPDETHERTFDTPGVYPYVCEPHEESRDMKGVVRVVP
jgi:plastocyanin